MRVLHPVTLREKLVASGIYRYLRGGELLKGEEHFSIHELPDGSWFVRIDYDWRVLDGTSQLIEALIDPLASGGRFQRIVAQLHSPAGVAKETMDFHADHVLIGISGLEAERRDLEIPLTPNFQVVMLKTALLGITASRWPGESGMPISAFGGYRSNDDKALVFDAALTALRQETVVVGDQSIDARVVELTGEFTQTLWLDSAGIALKRVMGELVAELYSYSRRAESGT